MLCVGSASCRPLLSCGPAPSVRFHRGDARSGSRDVHAAHPREAVEDVQVRDPRRDSVFEPGDPERAPVAVEQVRDLAVATSMTASFDPRRHVTSAFAWLRERATSTARSPRGGRSAPAPRHPSRAKRRRDRSRGRRPTPPTRPPSPTLRAGYGAREDRRRLGKGNSTTASSRCRCARRIVVGVHDPNARSVGRDLDRPTLERPCSRGESGRAHHCEAPIQSATP